MLELGSVNYVQLINDFWLTGSDKLQTTVKFQSHLELFKEFSCVKLSNLNTNPQFKISYAVEDFPMQIYFATGSKGLRGFVSLANRKFLGLRVTSVWAELHTFLLLTIDSKILQLYNVKFKKCITLHFTLYYQTAGIALNQCGVTSKILRYYTCFL